MFSVIFSTFQAEGQPLQQLFEIALQLVPGVAQALVKGMCAFPPLARDQPHRHSPVRLGPGLPGSQQGPATPCRRQAPETAMPSTFFMWGK